MIILGIDPGTRRIGYGVVRTARGGVDLLETGMLRIKSAVHYRALQETKAEMDRLVKKWRPDVLAVESLFFARNKKTGLQVAEARGVILLSGAEHRLIVKEYSPNEVKAGLTGYGSADKQAVAKMVRLILKKPRLRLIDDASDALAVALVASRERL